MFDRRHKCRIHSTRRLALESDNSKIKHKNVIVLVVPPEGRATADYMEGLFDLELDDVHLHSSSMETKNNISPSMLKKRIEVLQHEDKR